MQVNGVSDHDSICVLLEIRGCRNACTAGQVVAVRILAMRKRRLLLGTCGRCTVRHFVKLNIMRRMFEVRVNGASETRIGTCIIREAVSLRLAVRCREKRQQQRPLMTSLKR